jgi:hypothetical protein
MLTRQVGRVNRYASTANILIREETASMNRYETGLEWTISVLINLFWLIAGTLF